MSKNEEDEFKIGEITDASNFEELYNLIKQKKRITGSKETYKAEYLIAIVEDFRRIFKRLIETATKEEPFKKTNLLEVFDELLKQLGKITKKEELRFKALQLSLREIKETQ